MYIDVHCHLERNSEERIREIIERAKRADVGIIVTSGTDRESNMQALKLAEKYNEVKVSLGIYPTKCLELSEKEIDEEIEFIRKNKNKIAAIGEVGIDMKEGKDLEKQRKNFSKFIFLAEEIGKPIIVHSRKAEKECIEMLEKHKIKKVIMHCFFGKMSLAKRIEENGWMFSVPAVVKRNEQMQELVKLVNLKNLLCETDSPFLHPDKLGENEPCFVVESYKKIADIKKIKLKEANEAILDNYKRILGSI